MPRCEKLYHPDSTNTGTLYLVDQWSGSWASVQITTRAPYEVCQSGQRKLWDEVETAYRWWVEVGEPAVDTWQFTLAPSGQRIELRAPAAVPTR